MNADQQKHFTSILERFLKDFTAKYTKGTREHKTVLNKDYSLEQIVEMMGEEILDHISYYYTLKELLEKRDGK